jgi:hypothetical protein
VWKPLLDSIEQMEFRIFHNIFCSTFQIQKGAFAFDEYVAKVFQRSVLELIEIRLLDWLYVTVLLLINLGRVKLGLHYNSCEVHDIPCDDRRDVYLFTIIGKPRTHVAHDCASHNTADVFAMVVCSNRGLCVRLCAVHAGGVAAPGAEHPVHARTHLPPALREIHPGEISHVVCAAAHAVLFTS